MKAKMYSIFLFCESVVLKMLLHHYLLKICAIQVVCLMIKGVFIRGIQVQSFTTNTEFQQFSFHTECNLLGELLIITYYNY